jgi:hypothetical protein
MATTITDTAQVPVQLDFKMRQVFAPEYKYVKIPLNNYPAATIPMSLTGSVNLEWKFPTQVYNLARSYIQDNENIVGSGAGTYNGTWEDVFEMGSAITFGSAGGVNLVDLQNLQNY